MVIVAGYFRRPHTGKRKAVLEYSFFSKRIELALKKRGILSS